MSNQTIALQLEDDKPRKLMYMLNLSKRPPTDEKEILKLIKADADAKAKAAAEAAALAAMENEDADVDEDDNENPEEGLLNKPEFEPSEYYITKEMLVVKDSRPLYHWSDHGVESPDTEYDNWEPRFKPPPEVLEEYRRIIKDWSDRKSGKVKPVEATPASEEKTDGDTANEEDEEEGEGDDEEGGDEGENDGTNNEGLDPSKQETNGDGEVVAVPDPSSTS